MSKATTVDPFANFDLKAQADEARKPTVRFAFEFPELLELFRTIDHEAGVARERTRTLGFLSVALVLGALLLASAAPLFRSMEIDHQIEAFPTWLALIAGGLGLIGAVLGLSSLHKSSARRKWLQCRLQTETLRLFHFHYIAARLPEIASVNGDDGRLQAYLAERQAAFENLRTGVIAKPEAELADILGRTHGAAFDSLIESLPAKPGAPEPAADDVFVVWRKLRLDWQLGYCEAKLAHRSKGKATPRQLEERFAAMAWTCIAIVIGLHVLHMAEPILHIPGEWLEVGVVWTALIALAGRAMEDGLQPQRDVERYEQYRANILVARERFDGAQSFMEKLEVVRSFERGGLEEMRIFMRTHARARFLL
ncbi:MAG: hypothetical protein GC155_07010 [Alphaproteobacteria bacterium]|nr:hypothetical protein [Alphaproteobacteria bacterium]